MDPLLLKPAVAADALTVSERTLQRLTAAGHLVPVRIGRDVRYALADLERFVNDHGCAVIVPAPPRAHRKGALQRASRRKRPLAA